MISVLVKMGKAPKVIYMDADTGIRNSGLFKKYFDEHHNTIHYTKSRATVAERFIGTFKSAFDKRIRANDQWTQYVYAIMLTYNSKLMHSSTDFTPKEAKQQ